MNQIDPLKVAAFLQTWNIGRPANSPLWIELTGAHALMEMTINDNQSVSFNMNSGYPIKAFQNTETKEIKLFDGRRFAKN